MLPSYQSIQAPNAATRSIAGNVSSGARSMSAVPFKRTPTVETADNTNAPVQGKFTVNGKEYNEKNKHEIDAEGQLQGLLAGNKQKESIISIIRSYAAEEENKGEVTWASLVAEIPGKMKEDVKQFELASQQIITQYPMDKWVYVGLGGSPDPIAYDLMRYEGKPVVLFLPISNIDTYNLKGILEYMHIDSERDMVEKYNKDNETDYKGRQDFIDNEDGQVYMDSIRKPWLSANLVRTHLDNFVNINMLGGRKKVLLMDYAATGASLLYASQLLQAYYGDKITVQPLAFGLPITVPKESFQYLKKEGELKPAHLGSVFAKTTYKEGHRIYSKFDVADMFKKIKKFAGTTKLGAVDKLSKIPKIDVGELYEEPTVDEQAMKNLKNLFKIAEESKINVAGMTQEEGYALLDKMVAKYDADVDELHDAVKSFSVYINDLSK